MDEELDSLLNNPSVELDGSFLSTIASYLLNCAPKHCLVLPAARQAELIDKFIFRYKKPGNWNEARILEAVLTLFVLCLYYSMTTVYDSSVFPRILFVLQHVLCEGLAMEQQVGSKCLQLASMIDMLQRRDTVDVTYKLEIFKEYLQTARSILRKTNNLYRSQGNKKTVGRVDLRADMLRSYQEDSIQPICLAFMGCLAISHICCVLHSRKMISVIPGALESLLVATLTLPNPNVKPKRKMTKSGAKENELIIDMSELLNRMQSLALFVSHYVFTERNLQEVLLTRRRIVKHLNTAAVAFVQYRTSGVRALFGAGQTRRPSSSSKLPAIHNGNHPAQAIGNQSQLFPSDYHFFNGKPTRVDVERRPSDEEDGAYEPLNQSGSFDDEATKCFWALRKPLQPAYLFLLHLHEPSHHLSNFPAKYQPESVEFPAGDLLSATGTFNMIPTKTACVLERLHYHLCCRYKPPRIMDVQEDFFWVSLYALEYLYKKTTVGDGLAVELAKEKHSLVRRLKKIQQSTKNEKSRPTMTTTPSSQRAASLQQKKTKTKFSLEERLAAAKASAMVETKLIHIDAKLKGKELGSRVTMLNAKQDEAGNAAYDEVLDELSSTSSTTVLSNDEQLSDNDARSTQRPIKSVVWYCRPRVTETTQSYIQAVEMTEFSDNPFDHLPDKAASLAYAKRLEDERQRAAEEAQRQQQRLADEQYAIISRNRMIKANMLKAMREKMKEELQAKAAFKAQWLQEKKQRELREQQRIKQEIKDKEDAELREVLRIRELQAIKMEEERQQAEEQAHQLQLQKIVISKLANEAEAKEIIRRLKEEDRMRYCEERRRYYDSRKELEQHRRLLEEQAKRKATKEKIDRAQARVRLGNFLWHHGTFGYYDRVRRQPVPYIQYEDDQGRPYYYDPVYKTTQYRLPEDAEVRHYVDVEREEYDAIHGEGSYDAYKAEIAWKDEINRTGGYYNDKGQWIEVTGYYDENYEWVEYTGYYDANGKFVKYAKVTGDLSFMV